MLHAFFNALAQDLNSGSQRTILMHTGDTTLDRISSNTHVTITNGRLVVNGPVGDNVHIELTGSDQTKTLHFHSRVGKNATIKNCGHIEFEDFIGEGAKISTTFGNIKGLFFPKNTQLKTESGKIKAEMLSGDAQTHSGNIRIKTLDSHASVNTFLGDIKIDVANSFSRISSTQGAISIQDQKESVTVNNADGVTICNTRSSSPSVSGHSRASRSTRLRPATNSPKPDQENSTVIQGVLTSIHRKRNAQLDSTPFFEGMDLKTFFSACRHNGQLFNESFTKLSNQITRTLHNEVEEPDALCCPISYNLMAMPVKIPLSGGHTTTVDYESFLKFKKQGQGRVNPYINTSNQESLLYERDLKPDLAKAKAIYNYLDELDGLLNIASPKKSHKV